MRLAVDHRLFKVVIVRAALCELDGRQNTSHYWIRSEMPWIQAGQMMQFMQPYSSSCVLATHADSAVHDRIDTAFGSLVLAMNRLWLLVTVSHLCQRDGAKHYCSEQKSSDRADDRTT
jgi:drug/metabolite transporter superfamily protein YnfA